MNTEKLLILICVMTELFEFGIDPLFALNLRSNIDYVKKVFEANSRTIYKKAIYDCTYNTYWRIQSLIEEGKSREEAERIVKNAIRKYYISGYLDRSMPKWRLYVLIFLTIDSIYIISFFTLLMKYMNIYYVALLLLLALDSMFSKTKLWSLKNQTYIFCYKTISLIIKTVLFAASLKAIQ